MKRRAKVKRMIRSTTCRQPSIPLVVVMLTGLTLVTSAAAELRHVALSVSPSISSQPSETNPAAHFLLNTQLSFDDSSWRPGVGLGLSLRGEDTARLGPIGWLSAQYRFDIIEIVPLLEVGLLVDAKPDIWTRGYLAAGIERLYQGGWFIGLRGAVTTEPRKLERIGGFGLLTVGYQYKLNELR